MLTRREALVSAGLAKPGRGKFSTAAKVWLDKERAKGTKFSDDTDVPPRPRQSAKSEGAPAKEVATGIPDYLFPDEYRFPEGEYRAVAKGAGGKKKEYSLRECCNKCRVSLVNHSCDSPVIHGNIIITIEKR